MGARSPLRWPLQWPERSAVATCLVVSAIGAYTLFEAIRYGLGVPGRIGPGAFPLGVGVGLIALGVAVLFTRTPPSEEPSPPVLSRGVFFVSAAILCFVALIDTLGMAPTVAIVAVVSGAADRRLGLRGMAILALGSSALCTTIFIYLLRLPIRAFWW